MDIATREFQIMRKRHNELNGVPFVNYHTLSNNAVFYNPKFEQHHSKITPNMKPQLLPTLN